MVRDERSERKTFKEKFQLNSSNQANSNIKITEICHQRLSVILARVSFGKSRGEKEKLFNWSHRRLVGGKSPHRAPLHHQLVANVHRHQNLCSSSPPPSCSSVIHSNRNYYEAQSLTQSNDERLFILSSNFFFMCSAPSPFLFEASFAFNQLQCSGGSKSSHEWST